MNTAAVGSVSESPQTQIHSWARQTVQEWSEVCQHFLDRQKRCILLGYPSEAERADHRAALKWMLRITRLICATTDDPDYPDKSVASEIRGRLIQLEESWRLTQEQKPEGEAEKILREIFPE